MKNNVILFKSNFPDLNELSNDKNKKRVITKLDYNIQLK